MVTYEIRRTSQTPSQAAVSAAFRAAAAELDLPLELSTGRAPGSGRLRVLAAVALERSGLASRDAASLLCGVPQKNMLAPSQIANRGISLELIASVVWAMRCFRGPLETTHAVPIRPSEIQPIDLQLGADPDAPELQDDWPAFQPLAKHAPRRLEALGGNDCCWPVGSSRRADGQLFCGAPTFARHSYCREHDNVSRRSRWTPRKSLPSREPQGSPT